MSAERRAVSPHVALALVLNGIRTRPAFHTEDGLQQRGCGRCHRGSRGSAGEPCPNCGADSADYGPVFRGYHWMLIPDWPDTRGMTIAEAIAAVPRTTATWTLVINAERWP